MAESYRGLTIRIGGDTTKLTKALRAADQGISGTQSELRKLGDVLKMDPGNLEAYSKQMGLMGEKAVATSMRLYELKQAADRISKEGVIIGDSKTPTPIRELAEATKNAQLNAAEAKSAYNKVNEELASMYVTLTKYNEEAAKAFNEQYGEKLADSIGITSSDKALDEFVTKLTDAYDKFGDTIDAPSEKVGEIIKKMQKLRSEYLATENVAKKNKLNEQYEKLLETLTKINGTTVNFAMGTTEEGKVNAIIDKLRDLSLDGDMEYEPTLKLDPSQIELFRAEVERLKMEYKSAMTELQKANAIAQLDDLNIEIMKAEASVKSLAVRYATTLSRPSTTASTTTDSTDPDELTLNLTCIGFDVTIGKETKNILQAYCLNAGTQEAAYNKFFDQVLIPGVAVPQ